MTRSLNTACARYLSSWPILMSSGVLDDKVSKHCVRAVHEQLGPFSCYLEFWMPSCSNTACAQYLSSLGPFSCYLKFRMPRSGNTACARYLSSLGPFPFYVELRKPGP